MVNEDIAAVRAAFQWDRAEKAFIATTTKVVSLPVADLQRLNSLAADGVIVRTGGFTFRMPSKSEHFFWSKTELDEVHPQTEEDEDFDTYVSMIGLAAKNLAARAGGMIYRGSRFEACHFLDEICAESDLKQILLDGLTELQEGQGTKFSLPGAGTSVTLDTAVECSSADYFQMWIEWRVDEYCLYRTDPAERDEDRKEALSEAVRTLIGAVVRLDEISNVSFIPKRNRENI